MKITVHVIGNVNIVYYPGLKIITTFDWLKPRILKTHIPGCSQLARPYYQV